MKAKVRPRYIHLNVIPYNCTKEALEAKNAIDDYFSKYVAVDAKKQQSFISKLIPNPREFLIMSTLLLIFGYKIGYKKLILAFGGGFVYKFIFEGTPVSNIPKSEERNAKFWNLFKIKPKLAERTVRCAADIVNWLSTL